MRKNPAPEKQKSQSKGFLFDFIIVLIIAAFPLYVYHLFYVKPMLRELSKSRVYVFDLNAFIKQEKKQLLRQLLEGKKFSPREVEENVRNHLKFMLSGLPENVIVLDSNCVLHGGIQIPLKGEENAAGTLITPRPSQ